MQSLASLEGTTGEAKSGADEASVIFCSIAVDSFATLLVFGAAVGMFVL
jgi:hypothetical protein